MTYDCGPADTKVLYKSKVIEQFNSKIFDPEMLRRAIATDKEMEKAIESGEKFISEGDNMRIIYYKYLEKIYVSDMEDI